MMKKIMPPSYFFALLIFSIGAHFLLPVAKIVRPPLSYIGILLIIFGATINLWTDSLFKKAGISVKPADSPASFETGGPFRISRHPMYLGMVSVLLGVAALFGSLVTFLFPVLFIIFMELAFIPMEEAHCEQEFGDRYREYKGRVRRWI
ncbi:MAG: isoprenylcysteine carboxylmethyltransferase family protein [Candidatus Latescibacteria bacterium]|nr:isoprenylcysteine carboxylmethyltransferase family protein [Candidatus Latescibacterota bacterium]